MKVYADVRTSQEEIQEYLCYYECDTRLYQSSGTVLPQSKPEFAFVRVSGNTLAEEPS
jgi:hypothetical protein